MKQSLVNALRKGTQVMLKIDSYTIVLTPHQRTSGPGGVYDNVPQPPRPPQVLSVEPVGAALSGIAGTGGGISHSDGASMHKWDYELVGPHDAQMEINDTWRHEGTTYRIIAIKPENGYERRAVVSAIGGDPSYGS